MASLVLSGDTSGSITVSAPAVAGSNTQTLAAVTGTLAPVVSATAITLTNQTAPDFTGIPSWAKRITLMFQGVSANNTGNILVQLGTGATPTYTTSGYLGSSGVFNNANQTVSVSFTTGFGIYTGSAANVTHGIMQIANINSNSWVASVSYGRSDSTVTGSGSGSVSLSAALTAVRLYIDGTQQFDAGTINILYE